MIGVFKSLPAAEPMDADKVAAAYKWNRIQVFITIFIGYAVFYFVRKNLSFAKPYLINELGYTKTQVGAIAACMPLAYGLSKFLMGAISDRSNPRYFMGAGLILSGILNLFFGSTTGLGMFALIWTLNGWAQGMGWPPCGKSMAYWFSDKERGTWMSVWNVAHNIGGMLVPTIAIIGVAQWGDWRGAFYLPAIISIVCGFLIIMFLKDRPASLGLPPIEKYRSQKYSSSDTQVETVKVDKLSIKEVMVEHVFKNKYIWMLAFANVFVYFLRYGIMDWISVYLTEAKHLKMDDAGWTFFMYEFAAIPGTIIIGWLTDKVFGGKRTPMSVFCMIGVIIAVLIYWKSNNIFMINMAVGSIGLLIYGPVALIGIAAIDMSDKVAAGTAAGFTGLFGYVGGAVCAEIVCGKIIDTWGWNAYFGSLVASAILAIIFLIPTWKLGSLHTE
ncbi:MAG: MFS transporter [Desulfobacteraceae bacterium]|nr:MFS transporter [Desulfobacteraceae bacterium]